MKPLNYFSKYLRFHQNSFFNNSASKIFTRHSSDFTPVNRLNKLKKDSQEPGKVYFIEEASRALSVIEKGIQPLVEINDGYKISRPSDNELLIDVGGMGSYILRIDLPLNCIAITSPVSGVNKYVYDRDENLWLGVHDRHDMLGILTRDFLRHSIGCPNFSRPK